MAPRPNEGARDVSRIGAAVKRAEKRGKVNAVAVRYAEHARRIEDARTADAMNALIERCRELSRARDRAYFIALTLPALTAFGFALAWSLAR